MLSRAASWQRRFKPYWGWQCPCAGQSALIEGRGVGSVTKSVAPSEQAAGANPNSATRVETCGEPATISLMHVEGKTALFKMSGESFGQEMKFSGDTNAKEGQVDGQVYFGESVGCDTVERVAKSGDKVVGGISLSTSKGLRATRYGAAVEGLDDKNERGSDLSQVLCTLEGAQRTADLLEAPSRVSRGLMPGGKQGKAARRQNGSEKLQHKCTCARPTGPSRW